VDHAREYTQAHGFLQDGRIASSQDKSPRAEPRGEVSSATAIVLAVSPRMERRQIPDRRRVTRSGRRATDPHDVSVTTIRQELERLDTLIQRLVDMIQALTATLRKP